jgi:hypothetical protein
MSNLNAKEIERMCNNLELIIEHEDESNHPRTISVLTEAQETIERLWRIVRADKTECESDASTKMYYFINEAVYKMRDLLYRFTLDINKFINKPDDSELCIFLLDNRSKIEDDLKKGNSVYIHSVNDYKVYQIIQEEEKSDTKESINRCSKIYFINENKYHSSLPYTRFNICLSRPNGLDNVPKLEQFISENLDLIHTEWNANKDVYVYSEYSHGSYHILP